jgi:hypothetical protein
MAGRESANDCPRCCIDCADVCELCVRVIASESAYAPEVCRLCAEICSWCARQCGEHGHEHCRRCAVACRTCAQECERAAVAYA